MRKSFAIAGAALASGWAAPALADDWALSCNFPSSGLELAVRYDAGWPRHTVEVTRPGRSSLPDDYRRPIGDIMTTDGYLLFTQEEIGSQGTHFVLEINGQTMGADIQIGNGVSWDYKRQGATAETSLRVNRRNEGAD